MQFTPLIEKALERAAILHQNQKRKDGATPYIIHPVAVAIILSNYTEDEEIIAAGLLHDTLEDTDYTPEELEKDFGKRVKEIVMGVTEDASARTWREKKGGYIEKLKTGRAESLMVSAADKISNFRSRMNCYKLYGPSFENRFEAPHLEYSWLYEEIAKIFDERLDNPIVEEFRRILNELKTTVRLEQ